MSHFWKFDDGLISVQSQRVYLSAEDLESMLAAIHNVSADEVHQAIASWLNTQEPW